MSVFLRYPPDRTDGIPRRRADGRWQAQPAFVFYLGGNEVQGKETMGRELGTMFESEIPSF